MGRLLKLIVVRMKTRNEKTHVFSLLFLYQTPPEPRPIQTLILAPMSKPVPLSTVV